MYGNKDTISIRLHSESFCVDWDLLPHEVSLAFAKLQKKGLIGCTGPEYIQMELLPIDDD